MYSTSSTFRLGIPYLITSVAWQTAVVVTTGTDSADRMFRWPRLRALSLFCLALVICICTAVWLLREHKGGRTLQPQLYRASTIGPSNYLLLPGQTTTLCTSHGFKTWPHRERKIYDLFMLSTELDWLDIRLHTLSPYVDYFVIVESATTFTGHAKPLYLTENWARFAAFHHKVILRVIEDPGSSVGSRTWDHEDYLRNSLLYNVFPSLVGTPQEAQINDVLLVSDVDEVPKPETLVVLRLCSFPARLTLRSHFYYYSFQWLHRGEQWPHPQATVYKGLSDTVSPKDLRNGESRLGWFFLDALRCWRNKAELFNAAWHCSSCFPTLSEMQTKMNSFSHTGYNTAENRDAEVIRDRVQQGLDLFGRQSEIYDRFMDNLDAPAYILQQQDRFGYLLNRDGDDAGFTDWYNITKKAE